MKSKLPDLGTTIFTTMSKMASDYQAINLAQGFPNFPLDPKLIELLKETAGENTHQYAPMAGNPFLTDQIIKLTYRQYQRKINSTEVLVTAGATQAIFTAVQALVFSGDEVLIIDPAYDCYAPALELVGAKAIHVSMDEDFTLDWDKVEAKISPKCKMVIINNPHNPSGKVFTSADLEALNAIFTKHPQLLLLADEVYEYITFEERHLSINSFPELASRAIIVSSFGKTFHITGWKTGYVIAPEMLMTELKKVHQFLVFCVNSVAQSTLAKYLDVVDVSKLGAFYMQKRNDFRDLIKNSRFELLPSEGTYFQTVSYASVSKLKDTDFAVELVKKHGVAAIPMSVFYQDKEDRKQLRFCFAKDQETLEKAAYNLCKI